MYIFTLIQDNWTALHVASSNGHDEVVRVLLAAKATVNTQGPMLEIIFIDRDYGQMSFVPGHTERTHAGMHGHSN